MSEEDRILEKLNPDQRRAATFDGKSLLILAGAGSGKTRVITARIAWLVATGVAAPYEILAVTFTNKAAREMLDRVRTLAPTAAGVMMRTFHSFCAHTLRRFASEAGLDPRFTIYDDDDSLSLLHACFESVPRRELKRYCRFISRAKDYLIGPADDLSKISHDPDLPERYRAYQSRLDAMGNCDFGDLIFRTVNLLRRYAGVGETLRRRFRYILVDEYQDSNVAQFELLKLLTGSGTSLCVVGDDDQSIYRFRGAEVRNIITFPQEFPGTEIVRLEQNYRSTGPILELASAVVAKNSGRLGKTLWTGRKGGLLPILAYLPDQEAEAGYCADLLSDGRLSDTAVLYRTNAQSLAFESEFNRRGIPYRIVGSLRFYEREEVKDAVAFLSLFANPRDEIAFRRIVNKPSRGIGATTVGRIVETSAGTGGDLPKAAARYASAATGKTRSRVEIFVEIFGELAALIEKESLPAFVEKMLERSGLLGYHRDQDDVAGTSRVRNLEELVNASAEFASGYAGLSEFLELIELDRSRFDEEDESEERVTLITMHNTKGLEFRRVIITGLDEGLFPGRRNESIEDLEEERRIFYVSVTRAKDELHLTTCRVRRLWGRTTFFEPSRFISEIPEGAVKIVGDPGRDSGDEYSVGTGVYHDEYGYGSIIRSWYNGAELAVLVRFETGRTAQFLPRYTPLERMDVDV